MVRLVVALVVTGVILVLIYIFININTCTDYCH